MFRAGSEMARERRAGFSYALLSPWPMNTQHSAKTEVEKKGLQHVVDNKGQNFYGEETLAGKKYFTAVYPDYAVARTCVTCRNEPQGQPETRLQDRGRHVMGVVVIRISLES